jgi:diguanylate cyclase (GGDEF)-like protein
MEATQARVLSGVWMWWRRLYLLALASLFFAPGPGAAAERVPDPIQVRIDARAGPTEHAVYVVHILSPGMPVLVVAGGHPRFAYLDVNAVVRQVSGVSASIGAQPLGRSVTSLWLAGLTPSDRVAIRVDGGDGTLHIIADPALLSSAAETGLEDGLYIAFVLSAMIFALAQFRRLREWTDLWYAVWILGGLLIMLSRSGYFGFAGAALAIMQGSEMIAGVGLTGFVIAYLRLRSEAPRLIWMIAGTTLAAFTITPLVRPLFGDNVDAATSLMPLIGIGGFKPAGVLLLALAAMYATLCVHFAVTLCRIPGLFFDERWVNATFLVDLAAFGIAGMIRRRYVVLERTALRAELLRSEFDAHHDPLTGLLNRRGFDEWVREATAITTVMFIDLDGFKAVNDRGGHAAGDEALRATSRIIRDAVRDCDAVARIGGDEFVVAVAGATTDATISRVRTKIATEIAAIVPLGSDDGTRIGASIGTGFINGTTTTIDLALRDADRDAYRIKAERYAAGDIARRTR